MKKRSMNYIVLKLMAMSPIAAVILVPLLGLPKAGFIWAVICLIFIVGNKQIRRKEQEAGIN